MKGYRERNHKYWLSCQKYLFWSLQQLRSNKLIKSSNVKLKPYNYILIIYQTFQKFHPQNQNYHPFYLLICLILIYQIYHLDFQEETFLLNPNLKWYLFLQSRMWSWLLKWICITVRSLVLLLPNADGPIFSSSKKNRNLSKKLRNFPNLKTLSFFHMISPHVKMFF